MVMISSAGILTVAILALAAYGVLSWLFGANRPTPANPGSPPPLPARTAPGWLTPVVLTGCVIIGLRSGMHFWPVVLGSVFMVVMLVKLNVLSFGECQRQLLVLAEMGQQTQLDLRIVRRQQAPAFTGHKRLPDLLALLAPHRDILKVGVARTQTARRRYGLVKRGVDAASLLVHHLRQRIDVGALQLGDLPVLQDLPRQGATGHVQRGQLVQRLLVGARRPGDPRAALHWQLQFVEQHGAQLRQRADVERVPGQGLNLLLDGR